MSGRHSVILLTFISKKIKMRYSEIKDVFKVLTVQNDQTTRAISLLEEISTFWSILILYIME
jgi:hypothetical protein